MLGSWAISSNKIASATADAAAVVDAFTSDVEIQLDVSAVGRDAIVFRATDADNYWMLARYRNTTTTTSCFPVTRYQNLCGETVDGSVINCFVFAACGSCPNCAALVGFGTDGTECNPSNGWPSGGCTVSATQSCPDDCFSTTTTTNRIYLIKKENGTYTNVNFWTVASGFAELRVKAEGSTITVWTASGTTQTVTGQSFNQNAILHGVGRRNLGNQSGTAMDNFDLTLATA
jgi:hypothetical protein